MPIYWASLYAKFSVNITNDIEGMRRALKQAAKSLFIATPNPRVGCVIVQNGEILAEGHTHAPGEAHAEADALRNAAAAGKQVRGATVYVTLEPCSHQGRTPPCADALIAAGIKRVVIATLDSNPLVAGGGVTRLQQAGIEVVTGVLEVEAREINIGFFSRMERGRPWVRMKIASSLDGGTALLNGSSQWITSEAAREDGHVWRAQSCAILTGIGTVDQDDPQMNVRAIATTRQPKRIVIDSKLQINPDAKILHGGGTWIFAVSAKREQIARLQDAGNEVILLPDTHGKVDLAELMRELGRREINELHLEAGFKLNGSLLKSGCIDELLIYLAPSLLGQSMGMANLPTLIDLADRLQFSFHEVKQIGKDLRLRARDISLAKSSSSGK
ncbi:MAG: bifunctional diaminohydroxyphosphoribosylaminopyrimidine [Pseudomonadota bacterium]